MNLPALSIREPWVTLITHGNNMGRRKTIETRTWHTTYRGVLLLCTSRRREPGAYRSPAGEIGEHPLGCAVALCRVSGITLMSPMDAHAAMCEYSDEAYSWHLVDVYRLAEPFAVCGRQRLFQVEVSDAVVNGYTETLAAGHLGNKLGRRRCRICGCTDDRACVTDGVPCHWVEDDLCSACVPARATSESH